MIQPEGEYRHRWRKGDIVIWDNRCSYHKAAGDYPPEEDRIHWRVSIKERAVPSEERDMAQPNLPPWIQPLYQRDPKFVETYMTSASTSCATGPFPPSTSTS